MLWEMLLAVILAAGIFTAFNELRLKQAVRKSRETVVKSKRPTGAKELEKQHK